VPSIEDFPNENSENEGGKNEDSENKDNDNKNSRSCSDIEDLEVEVEVEDKRPRCSKPRESLKAAENTQQRKDGLLDMPRRLPTTVKGPAKRCKLGKKTLQVAREMSQLLDVYSPPPSNNVILNS
jgi:hypothetical protein